MMNAGEFNKRISIVRRLPNTDSDGFNTVSETEICKAWAKVDTAKGFTLLSSGSNFEDATTRLLIRKPSREISRKDIVVFAGKRWAIKYLNNVNEANKIIELQVEEVTQNG